MHSWGTGPVQLRLAGYLLNFLFVSASVAALLIYPVTYAAAAPPSAGLQHSALNLSDYRGSVIVLHLWATWCRPCVRGIPSLVRFYKGPYQRMKQKGLLLLTVSNDVRRKDLTNYLASHPLPFPVFYDSLGTVNEALKLRGVPHTVVIDRNGQVLGRLLGGQNWQSNELLALLNTYADR